MLTKLKQQWTQLKHYPPGQRFRQRYDAHRRQVPAGRSWGHRVVIFGLAAILAAIGVVLVFIPGPAILFFFLAGAVLAEESRAVARLLDWLEVRSRRVAARLHRWWERRSGAVRVMVCLFLGLLGGAAAYLSYRVVV